MTPEGAVVNVCLEYLTLRGAYVWRNNTGALRDKNNRPVYFGKVGSADILGILPGGRFLAVECKAGRGKPSEKQLEFLENVKSMGGLALIVWSVDELILALKKEEDDIALRRSTVKEKRHGLLGIFKTGTGRDKPEKGDKSDL
jgi:hypothetical protein